MVQGNVAKRRRRYMQDLFTTLVDAQWRWTLMVFSMSFLLSWTSFALIWWLISYTHGDLEALDDPLLNSSNSTEPMKPCITNINGFMSCFLFSVETQHTIGYGNRYINEECPAAIFTMCLQSIAGVFIQVRKRTYINMDLFHLHHLIYYCRHLWWELCLQSSPDPRRERRPFYSPGVL